MWCRQRETTSPLPGQGSEHQVASDRACLLPFLSKRPCHGGQGHPVGQCSFPSSELRAAYYSLKCLNHFPAGPPSKLFDSGCNAVWAATGLLNLVAVLRALPSGSLASFAHPVHFLCAPSLLPGFPQPLALVVSHTSCWTYSASLCLR